MKRRELSLNLHREAHLVAVNPGSVTKAVLFRIICGWKQGFCVPMYPWVCFFPTIYNYAFICTWRYHVEIVPPGRGCLKEFAHSVWIYWKVLFNNAFCVTKNAFPSVPLCGDFSYKSNWAKNFVPIPAGIEVRPVNVRNFPVRPLATQIAFPSACPSHRSRNTNFYFGDLKYGEK